MPPGDDFEITSTANPRIKATAALRDRRERESSGLTLADGAREIGRALAAGVEVVELFGCLELVRTPDAIRAL
ncbi:MAG: TrmH family RNA methyltransferase, partial [Candidatus Limnocylindrales bacterium]